MVYYFVQNHIHTVICVELDQYEIMQCFITYELIC